MRIEAETLLEMCPFGSVAVEAAYVSSMTTNCFAAAWDPKPCGVATGRLTDQGRRVIDTPCPLAWMADGQKLRLPASAGWLLSTSLSFPPPVCLAGRIRPCKTPRAERSRKTASVPVQQELLDANRRSCRWDSWDVRMGMTNFLLRRAGIRGPQSRPRAARAAMGVSQMPNLAFRFGVVVVLTSRLYETAQGPSVQAQTLAALPPPRLVPHPLWLRPGAAVGWSWVPAPSQPRDRRDVARVGAWVQQAVA
ncbi:hypothetical protein CDD83_8532 [Cordyceps sp. RAO-2017]|nr:hypothetical protein CDD83_8532 [Cordyceps sp. RAO-2017]